MTPSLLARVDDLFRQQVEAWPLLRTGVEGLSRVLTHPVVADGTRVLLRHLPHRVASTTAVVDRESIARRPCFLCAGNLPPEQRGLPLDGDFTLLCNPFPIVERHLTVVHREHREQRIAGAVGTMLDLAAALPGLFAAYNGPLCGASAPDHLHLQAGSSEGLPILRAIEGRPGPAVEAYGVRALLLRGERSRVLDETERALSHLAAVTGQEPEAWCNVVVFHGDAAGFSLVLFPRSKHRPDAFHTGELTVSPATLDMSGILVTPYPKDFERLTGEEVAALFREVTLPADQFREVVARLGKL